MSEYRIIGIVGGVGPFAGLDLNRKIFNQTIALSDQEHLTVLLFSDSSNIPDRTQYLLGKTPINPAEGIFNIITKLADAGADVIGIPCNTSHAPEIWNEIENKIQTHNLNIELINMIEETAVFIKDQYPNIEHVGVLGTTGTIQANVYSQIKLKGGYNILYPDDQIQNNKVHLSIYSPEYGIKAHSDPVSDRACKSLLESADHLISKGAQTIILGCTEIPLAIRQKNLDNIPIIDPTKILARALISRAAPGKVKSIT